MASPRLLGLVWVVSLHATVDPNPDPILHPNLALHLGLHLPLDQGSRMLIALALFLLWVPFRF